MQFYYAQCAYLHMYSICTLGGLKSWEPPNGTLEMIPHSNWKIYELCSFSIQNSNLQKMTNLNVQRHVLGRSHST